jgi:hypothetical protein
VAGVTDATTAPFMGLFATRGRFIATWKAEIIAFFFFLPFVPGCFGFFARNRSVFTFGISG